MREFKGRRIASTALDAQGERLSKEFLENYCSKMGDRRRPMHHMHDMARPVVGYTENHRLVADPDAQGEWCLLADVYLNDDAPTGAIGGFSISGVEMIWDPDGAEARILLSYPHYNNAELLAELKAIPSLAVGKWIKKAEGDLAWGALICTTLAFIVKPMWDDVYKRVIAPKIDALIDEYSRKLQPRDIPAELIQGVQYSGRSIEVRFIPSPGRELDCLSSGSILTGLRLVVAYLEGDRKANDVGAHRIVIFFDDSVGGYRLLRIEYLDGEVVHLA